jgi:hypothetical protein
MRIQRRDELRMDIKRVHSKSITPVQNYQKEKKRSADCMIQKEPKGGELESLKEAVAVLFGTSCWLLEQMNVVGC